MSVAVAGVAATGVAAVATATGAALAKAAGVSFAIPDSGTIPTAGFATITTAFSLVGVGVALGLARWSTRPRRRFVQVAVTLLAVSLVPPVTVGASASTALSLVGLHLLAGAIVIPALATSLGARVTD